MLFRSADGTVLTEEDDPQRFSFRLYLGKEDETTLSPAYMQEYFVKNAAGEYCIWDEPTGSFVSLGTSTYAEIPSNMQEAASFVTSPTGAISKIPVGYTVEVRDLLVGTHFKVEERADEIPNGYKLVGYDRVDASYIVEDGDIVNEGTVRDNSDPSIKVTNQQGWGITAVKEWSDKAFTKTHDDIQMAVFAGGVLVPGTLKTMASGTSTLYWYFEDLLPEKTFADYEVREVKVEGDDVIPYESGQTLQVGALLPEENDFAPFTYSVSYEKGSAQGTVGNVRTDKVINTRDGIRIVKTDLNGAPLAGASFTITDSEGQPVGSASYTSAANGLVTIA